jgi:stearoyl-CoA desaturase (delta-9 desaturase)
MKDNMSMGLDEVSNHAVNGTAVGEPGAARTVPRRLAIETPYLNRMQLRHFLMFNIAPMIGSAAAIALAFVHPITALDLALFVAMWFVTGLGISAGYHRLFTHRAYKAAPSARVALAIMGSMAGLGPLISWSAMHRRHHQCADASGDMHSPNLHGTTLGGRLRGVVHAHLTWMIKHEYPNIVHYTPDLLEDRAILRVSRHYLSWVALGLAVPAAIGGLATASWIGALSGLLWGGVVRMFVVAQSISALNSISHTIGSRPYRLRDNSRNNVVLGLLVWGEGWHHNHHAFPTSASFGLRWYRVDFSYWFIVMLKGVGLASELKLPARQQIESRNPDHPDAASAIPPALATPVTTVVES